NPTAAAAMVEAAVSTFGRLHAVVNNAGFVRDAMLHKMAREDWAAVIDVHLNGAFHLARAAAPLFRAQRSGAFVHMTSTAGLVGSVGQANYSAAMLGLVGLSTSLALEMASLGVRSNCIAPFAWSRVAAAIP